MGTSSTWGYPLHLSAWASSHDKNVLTSRKPVNIVVQFMPLITTIVFCLNDWLSFIIQFIRPICGLWSKAFIAIMSSAMNSSLPAEFATLLLWLGFAQVVADFLSCEQGIKMVDYLKIIPVAQMTSTYTTLNSVAAAFNIRKIHLVKGVSAVTLSSSGGTQRTGSSVLASDMVIFPMSHGPWSKLCGFRAWMD
jgi:hypothetical protein